VCYLPQELFADLYELTMAQAYHVEHMDGFTPLPALFFGFLTAATATYLWLLEIAKRKLFQSRAA
jgi:hypothetical protein